MNEILSKEELSNLIDKMIENNSICQYCNYLGGIYPYCADNDMKNGEIDVYKYLEDMQIESKKDLQMILDQQ